ncbi:CNNM domain-containing protein, partial [Staphylococcus xylosus]
MGTFISLIIFILLLVLTAFFVATEFAIVKVRTSRINSLANGDNKKAVAAQKVVSHLDEYLAACQLGITITALGIGMVGESTFEFLLHPIFSSLGLSETMIHIFTLISAFVIATYLHVVVGEMAPKTIAIQKAEQITLLIAKPIIMFYKLFYPFIYIL